MTDGVVLGVGGWVLGGDPGQGVSHPLPLFLAPVYRTLGTTHVAAEGDRSMGCGRGLGRGLGAQGGGTRTGTRRASPSFPISLLPFPMNGHVPPPPTRPLAGLPNSGASTHLAVPLPPSSHTAISTGLVLPLRTRSQRRSCWPGRWAPWNRQTRPSKRQSTCSWLSPNGAAWPHP